MFLSFGLNVIQNVEEMLRAWTKTVHRERSAQ